MYYNIPRAEPPFAFNQNIKEDISTALEVLLYFKTKRNETKTDTPWKHPRNANWVQCLKITSEKKKKKKKKKKIILGGDFNVTLDPDLDCSGGNPTKKDSVKHVQDVCLNFDLVDIWRVRNPECKRFTWRQKNPFIQRRLDYWLLGDSYQEEVEGVDIISSINSDHSAIVLYFLKLLVRC